MIVVLGVGLGAGRLLSRRLLAPLHTINRAAAKAGEGDLTYRIHAQGPHNELKQLADTFDTTLGRLEESFAAHQRFAPFYRARPRVASDRSGHGLGLAIVRSVVRGHHGTVTAHARAGATGGLLVRVELPARQEPPAG